MTKPARFTQADVQRFIRALKAEGIPIGSITLTADGIKALTPDAEERPVSALEAWRRKHGPSAA